MVCPCYPRISEQCGDSTANGQKNKMDRIIFINLLNVVWLLSNVPWPNNVEIALKHLWPNLNAEIVLAPVVYLK